MRDPLAVREAFWHRLQRGLVSASQLETETELWAEDLWWLLLDGKQEIGGGVGKPQEQSSAVIALMAARLVVSRERARVIVERLGVPADTDSSFELRPSSSSVLFSDMVWYGG
ncbi:hypothetical protein F1559_004441 [Cyanidiococcus yangmingshanensis]|uniref:Uncharacterized protein n=1 Tax=Cyanidiococcus yangmingshanensis TaxID=2690220 RepID=A0A7J7IN20_9RHOD|nr:hypothetical protein F1559_004441 [Cyanidiococcus yangmingshanensis]